MAVAALMGGRPDATPLRACRRRRRSRGGRRRDSSGAGERDGRRLQSGVPNFNNAGVQVLRE